MGMEELDKEEQQVAHFLTETEQNAAGPENPDCHQPGDT